jgi:glucose-1-phosphate cytidylyltransferase
MENNMKAVILAGGLGTRIGEDTVSKPKPMIEIGGIPILVHIMKHYSSYGITEFIICCGYKGYVIKEYFTNYMLHRSDFTIDMGNDEIKIHHKNFDNWKVTLVDTGDLSMTGGRLKRVEQYLRDEEVFHFTYGDGLSNVNLDKLTNFHLNHGKIATVTSVSPPGRFGSLVTEGNIVKSFQEKPMGDGGRINGGYFVLKPEAINSISDDDTVWEQDPLIDLASSGQLMAFPHDGFWQPMDTLRDKNLLIDLWDSGQAPWVNRGEHV